MVTVEQCWCTNSPTSAGAHKIARSDGCSEILCSGVHQISRASTDTVTRIPTSSEHVSSSTKPEIGFATPELAPTAHNHTVTSVICKADVGADLRKWPVQRASGGKHFESDVTNLPHESNSFRPAVHARLESVAKSVMTGSFERAFCFSFLWTII